MAAHFHRAEHHHHSPIVVFLQWLIAVLGFLWGTQARAEAPVWQPAWFADLASEVAPSSVNSQSRTSQIMSNRSPSSLNRTSMRRTPSMPPSPPADADQSAERSSPLTSWISTTSPDSPDPAQFTSYETAPLHLTPTVTLFRIPE